MQFHSLNSSLKMLISCGLCSFIANCNVIYHLGEINSDHYPLLLDTNPIDNFMPRPFRFEAAWTRDPRSHDVIKDAWKKERFWSACSRLYRKQDLTRTALRKWNREIFGH